jgi:hypothetical protein
MKGLPNYYLMRILETMRRRTILATGPAIGMTVLAGCGSEDPDQETERTTQTDEGDGPSGDQRDTGNGLSATIEPSASEITWGEEYSVEVTLVAGSDYPTDWAWTDIGYATQTSSGKLRGTDHDWDLPTGQQVTQTFEFGPPATGEVTFTLHDLNRGSGAGKPIAKWTLTVEPPEATFGEPIAFYDGLEITTDARVTETIDTHLFGPGGDNLGIHTVRPTGDNQWAVVTVTARNSGNEAVRLPSRDDISMLAEEFQLEQTHFVPDGEYTVSGDAPEYANIDFRKEDEYYPRNPPELVPTAAAEGTVVFIADGETTKDDLAVLLHRNDLRARWA